MFGEPNKEKNMNVFERNPGKTTACFLLASLLILDFSSANLYKLIYGYPRAFRPTKIEMIEKAYRIPSKFYHHDLAPKKTAHTSWGPYPYTVYTDSLGFRDKSTRDIALTSNEYRIVFMGDSFTEGLGVDFEDSFVGLIGAALSKKGIEVFNAGVTSYSPIIYWRKLKYLIEDVGLKFNQVVVFVDIGDANDESEYYFLNKNGNVENKKSTEPGVEDTHEAISKSRWVGLYERLKLNIGNNSILMYAVLHRLCCVFLPNLEQPYDAMPINSTRSRWTFDDRLYQEYGKDGLNKMQLHMEKLYDLLNKNNIKLTVAVYPWPAQIMHHDLNSIQVAFWDEWCRKHGVHFINYFPYFIKGMTEKDERQAIDEYFLKKDAHWSKKGHRLIADIFLKDYENIK
jgi:lysophospholipase L1-like esterase